MGTRRYNYTERENMKAIGATLTKAMKAYVSADGGEGMITRELSDITGLAQTSVTNIMSGSILPGRDTLNFMLDVLGVTDKSILDKAATKSIHSELVKRRMDAFYGRPAPSVTPTVLTVSTASERRSAAVDVMLERIGDLADVDWDDVIEYLRASDLTEAQCNEAMRAIWGDRR